MRRGRVINTIILILTISTAVEARKQELKTDISDTVKYQRDSLFIEGIRLKQQKLYDSAYVAFSRADSIDGNNSAICYEMGLSLLSKDFDKAHTYFAKADELSSDNYYYKKMVITTDLYAGKIDEAIKGYEKLLKQFPDHEGDLYDLAELYIKKGDTNSAIRTFDRLERLIGTDRYVSLSKVNVYIQSNDIKSAHKTLDKLIKEMPLDASLWAYKGDLYMESRNLDLAYEAYNNSLKIDPDNGYAIESLYVYYIRVGDTQKADEYMNKIFSSSDITFKHKREYLNQIIKYYGAIGKSYSELDTIYKCIITAEPENSEARLIYSDYLVKMNRGNEAIEQLRSAVYVNPQCKQCWEYLLFNVAEHSDSVLVEKVLSDAMDAIPESADFYFYSGLWEYSKSNKEYALSQFLKADSIVEASGQKELTSENRKELWSCLFNIYYNKGEKQKYYSYLEKSIATFPDDLMGINNYAYIIACDGGDLDRAEALSKKTIDKEPLEPIYLDTYAYILMKKGKLTYAKFYIEQAIEYMKSAPDAVIYEHYGDILFKLGDVEGALTQWKISLQMERDGQDKEKLKEKIEKKEYVE